jgi:hypothetical protein
MKNLCLVLHHHLKAFFCVAAIAGKPLSGNTVTKKGKFEDAKERLGSK